MRQPRKPLLLRIAPWILIPWTLFGAAFTVAILASGAGITVSGVELTATGFYYLLPIDIASTALALVGSIGLIRERLWARPLLGLGTAVVVIAYVAVLPAAAKGGVSDALPQGAIVPLLWAVSFGWYFYVKPSVRQYYQLLQGASRTRPAGA